MSSPVRLALVGTGAIAKSYSQALRHIDTAVLAAACDTDPAAVASFAEYAGCERYTDLEEMIAGERLDGIIVCTPPATHEHIVMTAMHCGLNVLCEKPLTTDVPSARRIINAAIAERVLLTMASKFRFVDDVRRARDLVAEGAVGDLILIENAFTSRVDMSQRWNSDPAVSGGGVLIDNGTHAVDLLRFFMGRLCDVQIFEGRRVQSVKVEDTVRIFVRNEQGAIGTADLSWSINKELDHFLRIYGSTGTILIGWKESRYKQSDVSDWVVFGSGYDKVHAFKNQIANFVDAIVGRAGIELSTADALASVEVIAAGYDALRESRWRAVRQALNDIPEQPLTLEATA